MDKKRVEAESRLLYKAVGLTDLGPNGLVARIWTTESLSKGLVPWLSWVAEKSTFRKKVNCGYSSRWWTMEVEQAAREARRAERLAKVARADYYWRNSMRGSRSLPE
ncbi:uncharacterized protein B0T15DRAFT_250650 [Chaetomium strumarium]|uniref:Uncharacterized protein n=1 Tax=Chaetomium strumarium TaxID=1170767 RepID=A0AAJ0M0Q1_9PEZI|nr:hypothetical protein B0T15DRAFT_250650 [Chaetomium strumarium]